jgi:ferredoxin-NADP reductase
MSPCLADAKAANRRPQDAAFLAELQRLETVNPSYRLIGTMTAPQESSRTWAGETGVVQRTMLERHLPNLMSPIYYFAGPPAMTMAMQQMLEKIGVDGQAMRYEEFYGY